MQDVDVTNKDELKLSWDECHEYVDVIALGIIATIDDEAWVIRKITKASVILERAPKYKRGTKVVYTTPKGIKLNSEFTNE